MKKWIKRIIFWGIILLIVGFVVWKIFGPKAVTPPEAETVTTGDVISTVSINATLKPQIYANVGAETLTEVTKVHAEVGDTVSTGDVLVTLDRAALWKQIGVAKLNVDRAVLAEQQGRENSSRTTRKDRLSLKKASEQARLQLQELYTLNAKGVLTSPIDGIITTMNAREGEVVTGTTSPVAGVTAGTIIRIIDPKSLEVEAFISESDIVEMTLEQEAIMRFDALPEESFRARITHIDPEASSLQDVIYFKTTFAIDSIDDRLRSGMSGDIDIITAQAMGATKLPLRFVSRDDMGEYVWSADGTDEKGNPQYQKTYIDTGVEGDEGFVEILSGVSPSEIIYNVVEEDK